MHERVEFPDRWLAAKEARIRHNRFKTGRRKLLEAIAGDAPEFKTWLLGSSAADFVPEGTTPFIDDAGYDEAVWTKANAEHAAFVKRYGTPAKFLQESLDKWGGLTDGQLAFARKQFAERAGRATERDAKEAERRATAPHWVAGRQRVEGVVQSVRVEEFGVNRWASAISTKGLILLDDGRKLWSTLPDALRQELSQVIYGGDARYSASSEMLKGARVAFDAKVEPKADDPTFAFASRPTKPALISAPATEASDASV